MGSIHNSNFKNDRTIYQDDPQDKSSKNSNDFRKRSYSYDDYDLLTVNSVSTRSQNSFRTYPVSVEKKYTKIANPVFEFALSTTCSAEKTKTFLKKGNNVTISLSNNSNDSITNISDSKFKNIDSDLNNKCNIDTKPSLILHTPVLTDNSLSAKIDTSLIELTQDVRKKILDAKTDFDKFVREQDDTSLRTKPYEELDTNVQKQTDKNPKENFNGNYPEEISIINHSNNSITKNNNNTSYSTKNTQENFNKDENQSINDEVTEVKNFLKILDKEPDFSSSESTSSISSNSSFNKIYPSPTRKPKPTQNKTNTTTQRLNADKLCKQALNMIKFLASLQMKKLDLKHEPRQRRIAFLEWIG